MQNPSASSAMSRHLSEVDPDIYHLIRKEADRQNGQIELTMVQTRKPQEGKVIVRLTENPLTLQGWTIVDNRGNRVTVSLTDMQTGIQLADPLFKNDSPDPASIRRQNN